MKVWLTTDYSLCMEPTPKPVMDGNGLRILLKHRWAETTACYHHERLRVQRVFFAAFYHFPGMVGRRCSRWPGQFFGGRHLGLLVARSSVFARRPSACRARVPDCIPVAFLGSISNVESRGVLAPCAELLHRERRIPGRYGSLCRLKSERALILASRSGYNSSGRCTSLSSRSSCWARTGNEPPFWIFGARVVTERSPVFADRVLQAAIQASGSSGLWCWAVKDVKPDHRPVIVRSYFMRVSCIIHDISPRLPIPPSLFSTVNSAPPSAVSQKPSS